MGQKGKADGEVGGVIREWAESDPGAGSAPARIFPLAQIRASRLEQIDQELLSAQDRVQQTEPQVLGGVAPASRGGDGSRQ